ncbi:MAG: fumarylacetoacetase [Aquihabitans sp.]
MNPIRADLGFGVDNLPYGVADIAGGPAQVVVRLGNAVLPVAAAVPATERWRFEQPSLNHFLAAGPQVWQTTRERLADHLGNPSRTRDLIEVGAVTLRLPFAVGDYVDFYSSIEHATNLGRILRPDTEPLLPNWRRLPVGYHGRSRSVVVSGTPVVRPTGLVTDDPDGPVVRRPTRQLDFELEVGFVVGPGNQPGHPIPPDQADQHVFGAVLVNDWSARDLQSYEYRPLGPFLGKSFLTTISPWVVPLAALQPHLREPPAQSPAPDAFLTAQRPWGIDMMLEADVAGTTICRTNLRHLYWTFAQQLAHLTSNGAVTGPGDLFATGTVSGPGADERGSLIEATWSGRDPLRLDDGTTRTWLEDGDTVVLRGWAGGNGNNPRIGFGDATGTVQPAHGTTSATPPARESILS